MNYDRIAQLYALLAAEEKKTPINQKRIDEINYYLAKEFGGNPPKPQVGSWWSWLDNFWPLPENWKTYITTALGAFVAINTQLHLVPQNVQEAILAAAVVLGFWAVNSTQDLNMKKVKDHLAKLVKK